MIYNLAVRHQRKIAFVMLYLFYAQFVIAATSFMHSNNGNTFGKYNHYRNTFIPYNSAKSIQKTSVSIDNNGINGMSALKVINPKFLSNKSIEKVDVGGPSQPEMQSFQSVNASNMVDLFSGDFSYNIPLMDVGGYPINIFYKSGVTMDQDASWVGLGWNINPGTITRSMRGIPDDFNGESDTIKKSLSIKPNWTFGLSYGKGEKIAGFPSGASIQSGKKYSLSYNSYKGIAYEDGVSTNFSTGKQSYGSATIGLSSSRSTRDGISETPSFSVNLHRKNEDTKSGAYGGFSVAFPYNSRVGLKTMQLGIEAGYNKIKKNDAGFITGSNNWGTRNFPISGAISFSSPSYTPTISLPFTSQNYNLSFQLGHLEEDIMHDYKDISAFYSTQYIASSDQILKLPAFGFLNFHNSNNNPSSILDFNREKEIPYRENPRINNIAIPNYTYDVFSITGEGTGGMFRAYRSDVGFVFDHQMCTKDYSGSLGVDIGIPEDPSSIINLGIPLSYTHANTSNGPWIEQNNIAANIAFQNPDSTFQASYFRNPGEKAINTKSYYNAIGGDDVVAVNLYQDNSSKSDISATSFLNRYNNRALVGQIPVNSPIYKNQRDKRTQVISYLSAQDASVAGLAKLIQNYPEGKNSLSNCYTKPINVIGTGNGLVYDYFFNNQNMIGIPTSTDYGITFPNIMFNGPDKVSGRWHGKIEAPETGIYLFRVWHDNAVRLYMNDSLIVDSWNHGWDQWGFSDFNLNLLKGERVKVVLEIENDGGPWGGWIEWKLPSNPNKTFLSSFSSLSAKDSIPKKYMYSIPEPDPIIYDSVIMEKRVNSFRKQNHISEIDVLNADGRKYVYGIPVYNLYQKEVTFASSNPTQINKDSNLVTYSPSESSLGCNTNNDQYYSAEEIPAYAHSFLLTGILSPDYVDLTGNGISDDDLGDAVKFNYSKICGITNPYKWRAPYATGKASYSEGLKTDYRDDKGNYVYGEKELWYMHSVESKNMVATFKLSKRLDALSIDEHGKKGDTGYARKLDEINLYNKADFLKNGIKATPVKTVHFEYSYELCRGVNHPLNDSGKLTLKKIWFTYNGNNKGKLNPYVFTYHANNPNYDPSMNDRWGTYKDALTNPSSTTGNLITNAEYPYASQDSTIAAYNAAAWTMVQVQLPSGGRIAVDYESDDYGYVQNKRAMQMCKVIGFGKTGSDAISANLYTNDLGIPSDNFYAFIRVPQKVSTAKDAYVKYLEGIKQMYFKLMVNMPGDKYGSGAEFVPNYVNLDTGAVDWYGRKDDSTIWVKIESIDNNGECGKGHYNPLATGAIRFLEQNLGSKAYPGSEPGDNMGLMDMVNMLIGYLNNYTDYYLGFDLKSRVVGWAKTIDPNRSYARVCSPLYKKYGGGLRVKRVKIYDNWNAMTNKGGTGKIESVYGQEYTYTTTKDVMGKPVTISSGVASYEPILGGEENPFRSAVQYNYSTAALVPSTIGYTEEPLGECFFPSASIGYSKVQVRSINLKNRRSANGFEETQFYTTEDFPTLTDRSVLDNNNEKIYKPWLANFLHLSARHYLVMSQGFKVELNDMNGKLKSHTIYAQNDSLLKNPVSYTYNHYKVDDETAETLHLSNNVMTIDSKGNIDSLGFIGKDIELMGDMRSEFSQTISPNLNFNTDWFSIPFIPPVFLIPLYMNLIQSERVMNRTAAMVKVINRYGILDSVMNIEKGSKISTRNLLYDSETGDVILTQTQNEFNDPIYNFSYPAHWAYDGMGGAYRNIDLQMKHLSFKNGKIISGLVYNGQDTMFFSGGDKLLISSKTSVKNFAPCVDSIATFPDSSIIWSIDKSITNGGQKKIYFVDASGQPFTGNDVALRIISSGRKNIAATIGTVTTLVNPLKFSGGNYHILLDSSSKVINASAVEYNQLWRVADKNKQAATIFTICDTTLNLDAYCSDTLTPNYQDSAFTICRTPTKDQSYSFGTYIYQDSLTGLADTSGTTGVQLVNMATNDTLWGTNDSFPYSGPLNRCGIWPCQYIGSYTNSEGFVHQECLPFYKWIGISSYFYIDSAKQYFIGMGADNYMKVLIDDSLFVALDSNFYDYHFSDVENYSTMNIWHMYPKFLSKGYHRINIQARNVDVHSQAVVGLEIYNNTLEQLETDTTYNQLNISFSTNNLIGTSISSGHTCPIRYSLDSAGGTFICKADTCLVGSISCHNDTAAFCYSAIKDTVVNPYFYGILGNYRPVKSYVYYTKRSETISSAIKTRYNGAFADFNPFWSFNGFNITPQYDTAKWVWNSAVNLFNEKGFELENKDPLGRYNSGLYGYNNTLPIAVTQNAHFEEIGFEGFEDYFFTGNSCNEVCPVSRRWNVAGNYLTYLDSTQSHTGQYSIRVESNTNITTGSKIISQDTSQSGIVFNELSPAGCISVNSLVGIRTTTGTILPGFNLLSGKKIVFSAWVKEDTACSCETYTHNSIEIGVQGSTPITITAHPKGIIIDGWQRYEEIIDIPFNDTAIGIVMKANGRRVFFDDIRIHPFNANMKSFVYDPINLRLMAELDENNYATFYEYDDDGTLVRVKKETERGIQTIKETRSALLKDQ